MTGYNIKLFYNILVLSVSVTVDLRQPFLSRQSYSRSAQIMRESTKLQRKMRQTPASARATSSTRSTKGSSNVSSMYRGVNTLSTMRYCMS